MARFVVDTNVYIEAIRTDAGNEALADWQRQMGPHLYQHSIVAQEILAGAMDQAGWLEFHADWVKPFERRRRLLTPTHSAWIRSARMMVLLVEKGIKSPGGLTRGFRNDCLMAASAREDGFTIVTNSLSDFETITEIEPGFRYTPPWP